MINKHALVLKIIESLNREAESFADAAKTAHRDATAPESKAENKYDTRGLEASYLASAQSKLVAESLQNIASYNAIELEEFNDKSQISLTAFIELEAKDGSRTFYFLGPKGGGTIVEYEGMKILLITPSSLLGKKLLGCEVGDCITIGSLSNIKQFTVISIS